MDADFGNGIAGRLAARFFVNQLPEAVEETAFTVLDAGGKQRFTEAKRAEFAHCMRQQRDADAESLDRRRALIDARGDAALMEIKRERKSADAAADDCNIHPWIPGTGWVQGEWTKSPNSCQLGANRRI